MCGSSSALSKFISAADMGLITQNSTDERTIQNSNEGIAATGSELVEKVKCQGTCSKAKQQACPFLKVMQGGQF